MIRALLSISLAMLLASCANQPCVCVPVEDSSVGQPQYPSTGTTPNWGVSGSGSSTGTGAGAGTVDQAALELLKQHLAQRVKELWGEEEYLEAGQHHYVKYLSGYKTRAHIDFERGKIWVATVDQIQPHAQLQSGIVQTLLMPADPAHVDLFSDKNIAASTKPFLLGQVLDHEGQKIEWEWRANRFSEYLLANRLQSRPVKVGSVYYVEIDMVANHSEHREYQYAAVVKDAASRYGIREDLIFAVIKTESSFNPYAVSHAGAYGLMQVIPTTAGADVFSMVKGRSDIPTKEYLLDPISNIDTGTAYLHLLKTRYLKDVVNPTNQHYTMISSYNSGTGGMLQTFDNDRTRAMQDINALQPNQVYWALTTNHPKAEARRYLEKVINFQTEFNQGKY